MKKSALIAIFLFFSVFARTFADPINFMAVKSDLTVSGSAIEFSTNIPYPLPYPTSDEAARLNFVKGYFNENLKISNNGAYCAVSIDKILETPGQSNTFTGRYDCGSEVTDIKNLSIQSHIFLDLFADVNHFLHITFKGDGLDILLTKQAPIFAGTNFKSSAASSEGTGGGFVGFWTIIKQFISLGVPHVLFGFDHVLFILAIHSIVRRLRDIVAIVTSFTIAHSLTLILSAYGLITVTARVVEPLIAFSIAYTAFRNISLQKNAVDIKKIMRERWISTFGFGLVHGLGFAGALTDIKVPKIYFLPALLSFNLGVEIAQFIVIGIFIAFLLFMEKKGYLRSTVFTVSWAIGVISSIWVIQRVFF